MIKGGNFLIENSLRPVIDIQISTVGKEERRAVTALIDTGAMRSFVSSDVAREMGITSSGIAMVSGATSKKPKQVKLCRLDIHLRQ